MKVYIASKSGHYNAVYDAPGIGTLAGVFQHFRRIGSYPAKQTNEELRVPFEEIEYIRKARSRDTYLERE